MAYFDSITDDGDEQTQTQDNDGVIGGFTDFVTDNKVAIAFATVVVAIVYAYVVMDI